MIGTAILFNLNDYYPDVVQKDHFRKNYNSVVRSLLFWTSAEDIPLRESLRLIDEAGLVEWIAV